MKYIRSAWHCLLGSIDKIVWCESKEEKSDRVCFHQGAWWSWNVESSLSHLYAQWISRLEALEKKVIELQTLLAINYPQSRYLISSADLNPPWSAWELGRVRVFRNFTMLVILASFGTLDRFLNNHRWAFSVQHFQLKRTKQFGSALASIAQSYK